MPMTWITLRWFVLLTLLCCCNACGDEAIEFPERTVILPDLSSGAVVSGTVRFEGEAPKRVPLTLDGDAWCRRPATQPALSEGVIVTDGCLADTLVWVEKGLEAWTFPLVREPAVMFNRGCLYVPHVLAVQAWQPVRFVSEDDTAHNINTSSSPQGTNRTLGSRGAEFSVQYRKPELSIAARCNIHPWMEGFIHVLPHPYFAVTATDGAWKLPPLPPGEYTLTAVHPKLGSRSQRVTLAAGAASVCDFSFKKR